MNSEEVKRRMAAERWTVATWAKANGFSPQTVRFQIYGKLGARGTRLQVAIEEALKRDGFYVPADDEENV